jgi:GNAT superfamily N-acetyltransferase
MVDVGSGGMKELNQRIEAEPSSPTIRQYKDGDEEAVLRLLTASLGGGPAGSRPAEFFRWKHIDNPFGRSLMLVAQDGDRVVGLRAFMRWRFRAGPRTIEAVRAVDTATHPDYQGRGIFSRLTRAALEELRGSADLVFNTPNDQSLPGYMKMGWRSVGSVPVFVKMNHPARFAVGASRMANEDAVPTSEDPAALVLGDSGGVEELLRAIDRDGRISTARDPGYLRWRYGDAPLLNYRAVCLRARDRISGIGIFRVRPRGPLWEATVAEVIVRSGDRKAAAATLHEIRRCVGVDHLTWSAPVGWTAREARRRTMSIRAPGGITLVTNTLGRVLEPDPLAMSSWALTLGDLEVF